MNDVVVIIQARLTSTRFPGKVLEKIGGKEILAHCLRACRESGYPVVVAIPNTTTNDSLAIWLQERAAFIRGPEDDVLARYEIAANAYPSNWYVRVTGDCPFVRLPAEWSFPLRKEYTSNVDERVASGLDWELFSFAMLRRAGIQATDPYDREHVTPWMRRYVGLPQDVPRPALKLSVDTQEDLDRLREWYAAGLFR